MPQAAMEVRLKQQTVLVFDTYIRDAEVTMDENLRSKGPFLWSDANSEVMQKTLSSQVVAQFWSGHGPAKIPDGLIHDWIGAAWMPDATMDKTLALIQDYDNHKNIYKPEVIASKLVRRQGNDFQIYLRLLKKKILTVVLDTDHQAHYRSVDRTRWICQSHTTRIAEVQNAGNANEKVLPPDSGYGFLWRLNSYWRFHERDGGVFMECRAISLTRDVPLGLGWIIEPIIQRLPKDSLVHTIECTRQALQAEGE
jgi:IS1 family transposase